MSASLVRPGTTNCRAGVPFSSPAPFGCTSWLAKLTFSDSGLNCTVTAVLGSMSLWKSLSSWTSFAFSSFIASGTAAPRALSVSDW